MYHFLRSKGGWWALLLSAGTLPAQITEVPETVKPGKFLVEMDALSFFFDHESGAKFTALAVASTFLSTGLTDTIDVQVGADLFLSQKVDAGGWRDRKSGIGDVYVRTKWKFLDNEAAGVSAALLPFVVLPTNTGGVGSNGLQGGVIVPWQKIMPGGGHFHAMAGWDFLRNDDDNGYDSRWYASAALERPLTRKLGVYGEVTAAKSSSGAPWEGTVGAGVTLQSGLFWWWDLAVYRGLSKGAADWNPVLRLNWGF